MQIPPASVIHLLHEASHAILSTHSTQLPGYPYGTAVPLVVDEAQRPLLLISALAEHTKNLLADPRASLAVIEAGQANVQDAARATLVGRIEPFQPRPELVQRYLRYQPDAEQFLQLDFQFFRMQVERIRYIGGIGRMGWLDAGSWLTTDVLSEDEETRLLALAPPSVHLLGIDPFGIDYITGGTRQRQRFESALPADEIGKCLQRLLPTQG
ncbi:MAG: pyridoxamine 5'-phosphate oxidase [Betaproteobacteria bacterium HGW-Betaproteobacteria-12]|nr:MAG: pyridoxamine 5'-phosphate oxidase [Betaproteobacteria bacterium HGW-Betaproteobacteria-12]